MPGEVMSSAAKTLSATTRKSAIHLAELLGQAARERGVSRARIAGDVLRCALGRHGIPPPEYFKFRLFDPALSREDREAFVSDKEITRLNTALRAPAVRGLAGLFSSKLRTGLLLRGAGLPTTEIRAVSRATPTRLAVPVLVGADAIEAFLRQAGTLPVFGKPDGLSLGVGAASFLRLDGAEIVLGDGSRVPVARLAQEIARDYPEGYLFQEMLRPHPVLARLIGPVVGTLRVTSLRLQTGPQALFVMLKMPGPGAMVDGSLAGENAAAIIDTATGRIQRVQLLSARIGEDLLSGHVTGADLPGAELPDFAEALALAQDVHRLFPEQGVFGFDIILSDRGPLINEINQNPLASLVQSARGSGLYDAAFTAKYREALAVHGVKLPVRGVRL